MSKFLPKMRFGYLTSLVEQIVNLKLKGFNADHKTNIVLKLLPIFCHCCILARLSEIFMLSIHV